MSFATTNFAQTTTTRSSFLLLLLSLLLLLLINLNTHVVFSQQVQCFGIDSTASEVCSGQGSCAFTDVCYCNSFYGGSQCELYIDNALGASSTNPGKSCFHIHRANYSLPSGIYWINPNNATTSFRVYCDMNDKDEFGNAGYTLIQRREPSTLSQNFNQDWATYAAGFGAIGKSHWLGNDRISILTKSASHMLRIHMIYKGVGYKANYRQFSVGDSVANYKLAVSGYSYDDQYWTSTGYIEGDSAIPVLDSCGKKRDGLDPKDSFSIQNNALFSTYNKDNDGYSYQNMASYYGAGWWWSSSGNVYSNLNGVYKNGTYTGVTNGIVWVGRENTLAYSIPEVTMKVRLASYTCKNRTVSCSGHGICNDLDQCVCDAGFLGSDCSDHVGRTCNGVLSTNSTVCANHGQCIGYDKCKCDYGYGGQFCATRLTLGATSDFPGRHCFQIHRSNRTLPSGIYWINPKNVTGGAFQVYCDMDDKDLFGNAGWTVIQRREPSTACFDFNQHWDSYRVGFGSLNTSHWLGNENIFSITSSDSFELRVDMIRRGVAYKANYNVFSVGSQATLYKLTTSGYSYDTVYWAGNGYYISTNPLNLDNQIHQQLDKCGAVRDGADPKDGFSAHNNAMFSTYDRDNDGYSYQNMASYYGAGWWWSSSGNVFANLNGVFKNGTYTGVTNGIVWNSDNNYSMNDVVMKIRPRSYKCKNSTVSCSGHGSCDSYDTSVPPQSTTAWTDTCTCEAGYFGADCSDRVDRSCYGYAANNKYVCSARGTCVAQDTCKCKLGAAGKRCEKMIELGTDPTFPGTDCFQIHRANPALASGVYYVRPSNITGVIRVYCDMDDKDQNGYAGWTVIQRREPETSCFNFNQNWVNYRDGFGSLETSFWLGNEQVSSLTNMAPHELRMDLEFGKKLYKANYAQFSVDPAATKYRLKVSGYSYDTMYWTSAGYTIASNPMKLDSIYPKMDQCGVNLNGMDPTDGFGVHNGALFSTTDQDNDGYSYQNMANYYGAGWWWMSSGVLSSNLNGIYRNGTYKTDSIMWPSFSTSSTFSVMKIRRNTYSCKNRTMSCSGYGDCDRYSTLVTPGEISSFRDVCVCDLGFFGADCSDNYQRSCNGLSASNPNVCSSKGKCVAHEKCLCNVGYGGKACEKKLKLGTDPIFPGEHCFHIHRSDRTLPSGVYWVNPNNSTAFQVYCDMDDVDSSGNAGWTVIQRREPSSSCYDFNQPWVSFRNGFGSLKTSHWLGNRQINLLTTTTAGMELRVDMTYGSDSYKANYYTFVVNSEAAKYGLTLGGYSYDRQYWVGSGYYAATNPINMDKQIHQQLDSCGGIIDGLSPNDGFGANTGSLFSTRDADNDGYSYQKMAEYYGSGWWWSSSGNVYANLNGAYKNGTYTGITNGIIWPALKNTASYSMPYTVMKIRPRSFNCKNSTFSCSGHGDCDTLTDWISPNYLTKWRDMCICDEEAGYFGPNCADRKYRTCDGVAANSTCVCNGHGTCIAQDTCRCETGYGGLYCEVRLVLGGDRTFPGFDCFQIHRSNRTLPSGVYWINPKNVTGGAFQVYCDMDDKDLFGNAGWTVIQRREPSSSCYNFNQNWVNYRDGFGALNSSFWLGNAYIYSLTTADRAKMQLRVDMNYKGRLYNANYDTFSLGNEASKFKLTIGGYSYDQQYWTGNGYHISTNPLSLDSVHPELNACGALVDGWNPKDSFSSSSGALFSTTDADNDGYSYQHMANYYGAGWWWSSSGNVYLNLNGVFKNGTYAGVSNGISWQALEGTLNYSPTYVSMKVRPTSYTCKNRTVSCSGNGDCDYYLQSLTGDYISSWRDVCVCDPGFIGANCADNVNRMCGGLQSSDPNVCSGNGLCVGQNICACNLGYGGNVCQTKLQLGTDKLFAASHCFQIHRSNRTLPSGIYWINPKNVTGGAFQVYCDMDDKDLFGNAGWTVIQRREPSSSCYNFNQNWVNYRDGFGDVSTSHWLGNDKVFQMTTTSSMSLRIDMLYDSQLYKANYAGFAVASEASLYALTVNGFSYDSNYWIGSGLISTVNPLGLDSVHPQLDVCGNNQDGMNPKDSLGNQNGASFSTIDRDYDGYSSQHMANYYGAGWWWSSSGNVYSNLNGAYKNGTYTGITNGIIWPALKNTASYSMPYTVMKIRPRSINCKNSTVSCSGNGDCDQYLDNVSAQFISGYKDKCVCYPGFNGTDCSDHVSRTCNGISAQSTSVCSGKGQCSGQDSCSCVPGNAGVWCERSISLGTDRTYPGLTCFDIQRANMSLPSGVYWINPSRNGVPYQVYCDMDDRDTNGNSGWTVIQRREPVSSCFGFNQVWNNYRDGFGDLSSSHWLGNEKLFDITQNVPSQLRVNMFYKGNWYSADYRTFAVGAQTTKYKLTISGYTYEGSFNPKDGLTAHNGALFSTTDADNDGYSYQNMANYYGAGWWWSSSGNVYSNLNGVYKNGTYTGITNGVIWSGFGTNLYSIPYVIMKVRPRSVSGVYTYNCLNSTASCNGNGFCNSTDSCTCFDGYSGSSCNIARTCNGVAFNDHSVCSSKGACVGLDQCSCSSPFAGVNCEQQLSCFGTLANSSNVCSGKGSCVSQDTCVCSFGYIGPDCSNGECYNVSASNPSVCSGNGLCVDGICQCHHGYGKEQCEELICHNQHASDPLVCSGNGVCTSPDVCNCTAGHVGSRCEISTCHGLAESDPQVCSGKGSCLSVDTCSCAEGFSGSNCEIIRTCGEIAFNNHSVCASHGSCILEDNCSCMPGYSGLNCELNVCFNLTSNDPQVCSGHGSCVGPNTCTCQPGFGGSCCGAARSCGGLVFTDPSVCAGHGVCIKEDICQCEVGHEGRFCGQARTCGGYNFTDPEVCSGKGQCVATDICSCTDGYKGLTCELPICFGKTSGDTNVCSGRGTCVAPDVCQCLPQYSGKNCELTECYGKNNTDPTVCSSRGTCNAPDTCACRSGYDGDECELILCNGIAHDNSEVCNTRGNCTAPNQCSCDPSFGYTGNDCQSAICYGKFGSVACSGHGVCDAPDSCLCNQDYNGFDCSVPYCFGLNASDPEACYGRGTCVGANTCSCNPGYGSQDCSQPVCYGIVATSSAVCSGVGSCLSPNECSCADGYFGDRCEQTTCFGINNLNQSVCNSHGSCLQHDRCSCNVAYVGTECETLTCYGVNSTDSRVCSGQGACVGPNKCKCSAEYTGASCSLPVCYGLASTSSAVCSGHGSCTAPNKCECPSGYSGDRCQFTTCFGKNNTDPSVCNGDGVCASKDSCVCSPGFIGSNCEQMACFQVASNSAGACSGKGSCIGPNTCKCEEGFTGVNCESKTCYGINERSPLVCSGHGSCANLDTCVCRPGFAGADCSVVQCFGVNSTDSAACSGSGTCYGPNTCSCAPGYQGADCSYPLCFGKRSDSIRACSNHGSCVGVDKCECDPFYSGKDCSITTCHSTPSNDSSVCSGNGQCVSHDTCSCDYGYAGSNCEEVTCNGLHPDDERVCGGSGYCIGIDECICLNGTYGNNCQYDHCQIENAPSTSYCSGRGSCSPDFYACDCSDGYFGDHCEHTTCGNINSTDSSSVCSGRGSCTGLDTCTCRNGYTGDNCEVPVCFGKSNLTNGTEVCGGNGECSIANKCSCSDGYSGLECEYPICFGIEADELSVCSGRGSCYSPNNCQCDDGWTGPDCSLATCFNISSTSSEVCSRHGQCVAKDFCFCHTGFTGAECQNPVCYHWPADDSSVCSAYGNCTAPDHCVCEVGHYGDDCSSGTNETYCYGKSGRNACSGHGVCEAPDICQCKPDYSGYDCSIPFCFGLNGSNPEVCSGQGACVSANTCKCYAGYQGANCTVPECFSVSSSDSSVCSSHGKCLSPDFCRCTSGYDGANCETRLSMDIQINLNDAGFFVRSNSLQATAYFQPVELASNFSLSWTIKDQSGNNLNITQLLSDRVTSSMQTISLKSNVLSLGEQYELSVNSKNARNNSISKTMRFTVSAPPVGGVLTVSGTSGVMLKDKFTLNTYGWTAVDTSRYMLYRFGYRRNGVDTMLNSFSSAPSLSVAMPVTGTLQLFAQAKTESGEVATTNNFVRVNVTNQAPNEVHDLILSQLDQLARANSTFIASQAGTVVASVVESASSMDPTQAKSIVGSVVDIILERGDSIPKEQQVELISTLSGVSEYFSEDTSITTSGILSGLLDEHVGDQATLDLAITAVKNIVPVMTNTNSSIEQILSASNLLDSTTGRLRENLAEGDTLDFSVQTVEIVAVRVNSTDDGVEMEVPVPNTDQSEQVFVNVDTKPILNNLKGSDSSVFTQGEIFDNPSQQYSSLCNTKLVSPVVAVRVFSDNGELFDQYSTPVVTSSMGVNENLNQGNTSFIYVCKFFDNNTRTWQNDTSVCSTGISSTNSGMTLPNGKRVVTCSCTKPVAHAVSLDYVQSDSGDAVSDDGAVACTNPCGCGDKSKKQTGLPVWAIVLIVLAGLSVLVLMALCLIFALIVGYRVVRRKTDETEVESSEAELAA